MPASASSTNAPNAKPATSTSAAARTATSSPAESARADPAPTATSQSPKPTSAEHHPTRGDRNAPHLTERRWWPPLGRSHGHQRAGFMTATGQFLLALDKGGLSSSGDALQEYFRRGARASCRRTTFAVHRRPRRGWGARPSVVLGQSSAPSCASHRALDVIADAVTR